jgi:hypothetical protein
MPMYSMDDDPGYWQAPGRFAGMPEVAEQLGARISFFPLGDSESDDTPLCVVYDMQPGYVLQRHAHPCERFEVVVRGSITVGERTFKPGDVMLAGPGEVYGPKTAGVDGCTTVEVFANAPGAYLRISETGSVSNLLELGRAGFPTDAGVA